MISVRILGGLGNQMFAYASAKAIAKANKTGLKLDTHSGFRNDPYKRKYALGHFNIKARVANNFCNYKKLFGRYRQFAERTVNSFLPSMIRWYYHEKHYTFHKELLTKPNKHLYLDGYFQSPEYFESIKSELKEEFTIKNPPTDELNQNIFYKIKTGQDMVCVHARRLRALAADGSVVSANDNKILALSYYQQAIEYMRCHSNNPTFVLFGDDPNWLQENLHLNKNECITVGHNKGDENNYKDLWLMQHCQHFILSNSTFAWWAAYLAKGDNKITLVPPIPYWENDSILNDRFYHIIL
jgi:hypothetical protein